MSEKEWWTGYGPFKRWNECPSRPDPRKVLLFHLQKRGIQPEEHVSFLINLLDLQKSMIYNILNGDGFDAISRCRHLVQALKIHPPLLGIDAKYYPIERHPYWWKEQGFNFHADAQGYPRTHEVIAYLRTHRTLRDDWGKVKVWSQEDLGDATGLKKETVYRMEHDHNPLILESMKRRAAVASALGTLSGEKEPILFRLFGIDPQAYGVPVAAQEIVPEVHGVSERLTDETFRHYQEQQAAIFREYFTCHAQNRVEEIHEWLRRGATLLPKASTIAQRISLLALQIRYHILLTGIAREQCNTKTIQVHGNKAVSLAEQAITLTNPQLGHHPLLVTTNELLASALLWRAEALDELGNSDMAQTDIDRALSLLPALQSNPLKVHLVADVGLIHAHTGVGEMDRTLVLSYFSLAAQINAPSHFQSRGPDDHFIQGGTGLLSLRKAMALCSPQMKGATEDSVSDLLETAQRLTPPELVRQHTLIEVFLAKCAFVGGDYEQATEVALSALEKTRLIRSRLNRDRIEKLYQQLLTTDFRDRPIVAYLGVKLRTWNHGMDL